MEENNWSDFVISMIVIVVFILVFVGVIWSSVESNKYWSEKEYVVVDSNVKDVIVVLDNDSKIDYFMVTFENNKTYNLFSHKIETDFTNNSNNVWQLYRYVNHDTDKWYIDRLVRKP